MAKAGQSLPSFHRFKSRPMTTSTPECLFAPSPPVAILGVPFDFVTRAEAVELVERMIASRRPHYIVTPNVDFLVQASKDVELRRILFEAHLVVCDGTPLVWASRWLGNPLPERVAGSDLVPLLLELASSRGYRVFFLGATEAAASQAIARLRSQHPQLVIAGHYSPPFNQLLEMDHDRIRERITQARADLLLVGFGCPKQEKWIAMHYRDLGVPVVAGVGGTIDFLAGRIRRAPLWMQKAGVEWLFRLVQEPRRLFRRYSTDLWVFGRSILIQWWQLRPSRKIRARLASNRARVASEPIRAPHSSNPRPSSILDPPIFTSDLPSRVDCAAISQGCLHSVAPTLAERHWLLNSARVEFIDSTGIGWLIQWHKKLQASDSILVLVAPSQPIRRALKLLRLQEFFLVSESADAGRKAIAERLGQRAVTPPSFEDDSMSGPVAIAWHGEITAANVNRIWERTLAHLDQCRSAQKWRIDLSDVRFMDSSGLGILVRLKKLARARERYLEVVGTQPAVRNVIQIAQLTEFLAETVCHCA